MPKDIEIIPPSRPKVQNPNQPVVTVAVPGVQQSGAIEAYFERRRYLRSSKVVDALTTLNNSEAALFKSQTTVVEATIKREEALARLQENPERIRHELAVRSVQRADEYREVQHTYEVNEVRRMTELTHKQAEYTHSRVALTHSRTVLTKAEQQHRAQQKHGHRVFELQHKKEALELVEYELDIKEKRALLEEEEIFNRELEEELSAINRRGEEMASREEQSLQSNVYDPIKRNGHG